MNETIEALELGIKALEIILANKGIDDVASEYESELRSLIQELLRGGHRLSKADFRREMKRDIRAFGKDGFQAGWEEGGGEMDALESDDLALLESWTKEQQSFVGDFADWLTNKDSNLDTVPDRVKLWVMSLINLAQQAKARALGDPMLLFDGDDGTESCDECQEYKGQVHRRSWWDKRDLLRRNGNENYGCMRFDNCHHSFFHAKTGELIIA